MGAGAGTAWIVQKRGVRVAARSEAGQVCYGVRACIVQVWLVLAWFSVALIVRKCISREACMWEGHAVGGPVQCNTRGSNVTFIGPTKNGESHEHVPRRTEASNTHQSEPPAGKQTVVSR